MHSVLIIGQSIPQKMLLIMPHILWGSIVVIAKDDATMSIIDGQQRITSLTLLLIYLYHAIGVAKGAILQNMIFSDSYGEKSFNIQVPERKDCLDGLYNNNEYTPKDTCEDSIRFMSCILHQIFFHHWTCLLIYI